MSEHVRLGKRLKAMRFGLIGVPGRVVHHPGASGSGSARAILRWGVLLGARQRLLAPPRGSPG